MFKFRIRDLIWLTIVVALSLGWWMHQDQLNGEIATLNMRLDGVHSYADAVSQYLGAAGYSVGEVGPRRLHIRVGDHMWVLYCRPSTSDDPPHIVGP